jgi:septal ring factor EnvC (AmiA/AmiB activator)
VEQGKADFAYFRQTPDDKPVRNSPFSHFSNQLIAQLQQGIQRANEYIDDSLAKLTQEEASLERQLHLLTEDAEPTSTPNGDLTPKERIKRANSARLSAERLRKADSARAELAQLKSDRAAIEAERDAIEPLWNEVFIQAHSIYMQAASDNSHPVGANLNLSSQLKQYFISLQSPSNFETDFNLTDSKKSQDH